ncbi:hypothetical protein PFICI_12102 [Pestalotiopsis fici W106-1]|uniref:Wings apart-like protein C-terminal domain-containing protein n=1 Tax=Pestalotiopsis fici (strain W106-1 / CGMCC3.15140) TaxID=1229662 RepID=W3WS98_PESFW|nr:uncharacterized protein PFICI_12102 [Pestalotiopsis fici W106-1]ETS76715.1 hypothetical protein PFICI_12102 [Pestalotiopsis fici W106-1]
MASVKARPQLKQYGKSTTKKPTSTRPSRQPSETSRAPLSRSASDVPAATKADEYDPWSFPADDSPTRVPFNGKKKIEPRAGNGATQVPIERKRKIAQVYPANNQGHEPTSKDASPAPPKPKQRSRVPSPTDNAAAPKTKTYGRSRQIRSLSAEMAVDGADGILSSPPPTPKDGKSNGKSVSKKEELPFSPNTMNLFGNLNVGDAKARQQHIPVRPRPKPSNTAPNAVRRIEPPRQHGPSTSMSIQPAKKPRKKLIDALVEQMDDSDDAMEEEKAGSQGTQVSWAETVETFAPPMESQSSFISPSQTSGSRRTFGSAAPRTFARAGSSGSSLKRTYGSSNVTMLEEDNILESLVMPDEPTFSARRRLELTPKKLSRPSVEPEDEPNPSTTPRKIRDIHELRQAGANSRVADEMFDLSSRLGQPSAKPSSQRRAALLDVADQAKNKDFRYRLRDHGLDTMILQKIGEETDPISGYLIAAFLIQILASSAAPHITQTLQTEDAGHLFGRLMQLDEDIKRLVRDRKSNLSKRHQGLLLAVQSTLLELPIWQPVKPVSITPRTIALKCLDMIVAQDAHLGNDDALFPPAVTEGLFSALSSASEPDFWDATTSNDTFDVSCTLSVLEFHAVKAMEAQNSEQLTAKYLPSVADAFGAALQNPTAHGDLQSLLLKLVLNMTNSSITAPDIFIARDLILPLSTSICTGFKQASSVVAGGEEWTEELLNGLVLRLGILINFAEQSEPVKAAVHQCQNPEGGSPIKEMIQIFLTNHRTTAEADSEAKSQLNVAFGYLSVLLGYLCLFKPIRQVFRSCQSAKSMGPLVDSIQEFISHHRAMEASLLDAGVEDPRAHGGYTERLQGLVDQLDASAAYD